MDKDKFKNLKKQKWKQDHTYTDNCEECGKRLMSKDAEYSLHMFNKIVCSEHTPSKNVFGKEFIKPINNNEEQKAFLKDNPIEDIPF